MSKERELLIHAVERLKYINYEDDHLTNDLIQTIEELLAQPEPEQEPVVLQYRTKPNWTGNWSKWEDCRKESYEDYMRVPILHDWTYETRELYTAPKPEQKPLTPQQISEGNQSMFNVTRDAFVKGVKFAEKMHGIGGGE
jgi:hypothetical protein